MAKLYFRYGTMGCGKTMQLLQIAQNIEEIDGFANVVQKQPAKRVFWTVSSSRPVLIFLSTTEAPKSSTALSAPPAS